MRKHWTIVTLSVVALLAGCGNAPDKKPAAPAPAAATPSKTPACDCEGSGTEKSAAPAKTEEKPAEKKSDAAEKPGA